MTAKEMLLKLIKDEGSVKGSVINVERFINHKVSYLLYDKIANAFIEHFPTDSFDKILTVESSGIILASFIAAKSQKDFIFLKKKKPLTMNEYYSERSYSFTKQAETELFLSKTVVEKGEKLLFVDDFYANGSTSASAKKLIEKAGCEISGIGVIIDKSNNNDIFSILKLKDIKE
ncbi:MAG: phosphoribosyltransferase [Deferribacteraceae bacterium]|jgi:xanthine phosphoribosyltransferase|nr:phosphoribosyltransferase [Deferribacteraceae bacterium]